MSRHNKGNIYTNDNCIGCNRCIGTCPVSGANVSIKSNDRTRIEVAQKNCIDCGVCVSSCSHHAREYKDDTAFLLEDLANGKSISLIVDPSFYLNYADTAANILGYLKSLGIKHIYDAAFGADISAYFHAKYLKDNMNEDNGTATAFVTQTCPAIISYAEQYAPDTLPYIIPVQSPVACTATYLRKYLNVTDDLAFLSPCIAQRREREAANESSIINYNVTIRHLLDNIADTDISSYSAEADLKSKYLGNIASVNEGFNEAVKMFFEDECFFHHYSSIDENILNIINNALSSISGSHPLMLELHACKNGCMTASGTDSALNNYGPFSSRYMLARKDALANYPKSLSPDEKYQMFTDMFSELDANDFTRVLRENFRQPYSIPTSAREDIYAAMYKDTLEKRTINCHSCGYGSCEEMVNAIANGYAKMDNCVHYMNDALKYKIYTDPATGLPNEKGFYRDYENLIKQHPSRNYAVCVGNLNKLRAINNLYGTTAGDKIIKYIAKFLKDFVAGRGICARLEGGHFGLCIDMNKVDRDELEALPYFNCKHLGIDFPVTIRFGVYMLHNYTEAIDKIVTYAAFTMDKIHDTTRNIFLLYNKTMEEELKTDAAITAQMKTALQNDEFELYLQPQYDSNKQLVGAEALSRWIKDDGSSISPGVFIPIFEKNGFIREIDKAVWENGFKMVRRWMDENANPVPISVNISRISLTDDEIINTIAALQEKYNIDTSLLHFEITESAYMDNQQELIERVAKIRNMGFLIAMDDFGSGYSSLNTLKDVPLDILKLDMGFLRNSSTNDERGRSIIGHIIHMAHSLNLKTVAEGVETQEQADFLRSLGCDIIQGYLYARPMPFNDYNELIS